ncbi:UDP-3-O-[3-hydroxymyristoyl] glucosamine N-acyltransferase [Balneicella halophila]|uniref:UDP-3-O-acylglucosamine N-acyltransferase n=1 Tax=Balneicella halophila TaxID=1537566 RepID=A0A7L4UR26_BALHA|nr:UDP-3-O-(3-hydroxymyristoyl)glucosamine N-acyltransferase [Balneicella halophila]PVX52119.1 UDP-3-O-[3-hydroxymyristoyl] glucosamine N-acyltransferase [Balneicella halophila]
MEFTAEQIAEALEGTVDGDKNCVVSGVSEIDAGKPKTLTFLANPKYEKYIYTTEASIVLVSNNFTPKESVKTTLLRVKDPYGAMANLLQLYEQSKPKKIGIEEPSYVSKSATIGKDVYIGAFAYIGDNAIIGDNVKIYPNTYIGDKVSIDNNSELFAGVKIYPHTKIGKGCIIHSGAVIGADGFGFAPQKDGTFEKIPQVGHVILEDNVEIGANTCIDRAMLNATTIKQGVKLDNLIQVGHNCTVGENTVIAAQTGIAGSVEIGENCMIGGQVGISGHLKIADKVQIVAQTGISSSLDEGSVVMGSPSMNVSKYYKSYAYFKKLPNLAKEIKELKQKLKDLTSEK